MPAIAYRNVDPGDLVATFARSATEAGARVHLVAGTTVPADLLLGLVDEHDIGSIVSTIEPLAAGTTRLLAHTDLAVAIGTDADRSTRERADLGITSAIAAIAATGSLALDATIAGDRTTSLLPRVHLAVIHADQIVATPADLWHRYDRRPETLPSNLVLVTGPSRTGDIEQLLTVGVHGPQAVEIIVLT